METAIPSMKIATKVGHDQCRHDPRITSDFHYVSMKRDMADTSEVARFSVNAINTMALAVPDFLALLPEFLDSQPAACTEGGP